MGGIWKNCWLPINAVYAVELWLTLRNALNHFVHPYTAKNVLNLWEATSNVRSYVPQVLSINQTTKLWGSWMSWNSNAAIIPDAQRLFPILNMSSIFPYVSIRSVIIGCAQLKRTTMKKLSGLTKIEKKSYFRKSQV